MKIIIPLAFIAAACGSSSSGGDSSPIPLPSPKPPVKPVEPDPGPPKDKLIRLYEPLEFAPLTVELYEVYESQLPYIDDYLSFQREWVVGWGATRQGEHIPKTYLSLWNQNEIDYIDETKGQVKGIEKLDAIRKEMLEKCPVLGLPQYNSPVDVHWRKIDSNAAGVYRGLGPKVYKDDEGIIKYDGSIFTTLDSRITIYGENNAWSYPKQTTKESGNPYGIDHVFVHEWGHHLLFSIDMNLGRSSYMTHEMAENFATTIEAVCGGSHLDLPEIIDTVYQGQVVGADQYSKVLRSKTDPVEGSQYALASMESCIAHEKYLDKFDPNTFATALIEAYKRIDGRKLDNPPYPINFRSGAWVGAWWIGSSQDSNNDPDLRDNQPLLATRVEFLQKFREVYDCGLANELIDADIEGKLKFEW